MSTQTRLRWALICGLLSYSVAFPAADGDAGVRAGAAVLAVLVYGAMLKYSGRFTRTVAALSFVFALSGVLTTRWDLAFVVVFVLSVAEALLSASVLLRPSESLTPDGGSR